MTVPYRIRFSNHCDELRVAVVKEVLYEDVSKTVDSTTQKSWFPTSWFSRSEGQDVQEEAFRKRMQEMSLYEREKIASELDRIISTKTHVDENASSVNSTETNEESNSTSSASDDIEIDSS